MGEDPGDDDRDLNDRAAEQVGVGDVDASWPGPVGDEVPYPRAAKVIAAVIVLVLLAMVAAVLYAAFVADRDPGPVRSRNVVTRWSPVGW